MSRIHSHNFSRCVALVTCLVFGACSVSQPDNSGCSSDLTIQSFVATTNGSSIRLAWQAPNIQSPTPQYELYAYTSSASTNAIEAEIQEFNNQCSIAAHLSPIATVGGSQFTYVPERGQPAGFAIRARVEDQWGPLYATTATMGDLPAGMFFELVVIPAPVSAEKSAQISWRTNYKSLTCNGVACRDEITIANLPEGQQSMLIQTATTTTTSSTVADIRWIVDTIPPEIHLTGPDTTTDTVNLQFSWQITDLNRGQSQCFFDLATIECDTNSFISTVDLGTHTLNIVSTDLAGNTSEQSLSTYVTSDTDGPVITISNLDSIINTATLSIPFSVVDKGVGVASISCTFDGDDIACSNQINLNQIAEGSHTVAIFASDIFGNKSSATTSFTVDVSPTTTLQIAPSDRSYFSQATFVIAHSGDALLCQLDGSPVACAATTSLTVATGTHNFAAYATQANGLFDASPIEIEWHVDPTTQHTWTQVALGGTHLCAIESNGSLYCWGDNTFGKLGLASDSTTQPTTSVPGGPWKDVVAGVQHTCAIAQQQVYCWGWNALGQLGYAGASTHVPTLVTGLNSVIEIVAGQWHTCVREIDNDVFCWGNNDKGQTIWSAQSIQSTPIEVYPASSDPITAIYAFGDATILDFDASTDYQLYCGADARNEQASIADGDQTGGCRNAPSGTRPIFTGSSSFGCSLVGSTISCWGRDLLDLDDDTETSVTDPTVISGITPVTVAVGDRHLCAVTAAQEIHCWGNATAGQTGIGIDGLYKEWRNSIYDNWTNIYARFDYSCGLQGENRQLWCWGNTPGQLSDSPQWIP